MALYIQSIAILFSVDSIGQHRPVASSDTRKRRLTLSVRPFPVTDSGLAAWIASQFDLNCAIT